MLFNNMLSRNTGQTESCSTIIDELAVCSSSSLHQTHLWPLKYYSWPFLEVYQNLFYGNIITKTYHSRMIYNCTPSLQLLQSYYGCLLMPVSSLSSLMDSHTLVGLLFICSILYIFKCWNKKCSVRCSKLGPCTHVGWFKNKNFFTSFKN